MWVTAVLTKIYGGPEGPRVRVRARMATMKIRNAHAERNGTRFFQNASLSIRFRKSISWPWNEGLTAAKSAANIRRTLLANLKPHNVNLEDSEAALALVL
jgi:hypothetical protein